MFKKIKQIFGNDHIFKRKYSSYEDYLNHQRQKTLDPIKREKWLGEEWDVKVEYFEKEFRYLLEKGVLHSTCRGIGLGARTGQEIQAMTNVGMIGSIGIDLVECPPLVLKGDIHAISFEAETFGFAFTNIYDHALYPFKFLDEIVRVLASKGIGLIHLQVGMQTDDFGVVDITSTQKIENHLKMKGCEVLFVEEILDRKVIDMSTRLVFRKN